LCFEECSDNSIISKSLGYAVAVHSTGLIRWFVIIDFISQGREKIKKKKKPDLNIVKCHDFVTANLKISPSFLQNTIVKLEPAHMRAITTSLRLLKNIF
jgi:hypothetical protein